MVEFPLSYEAMATATPGANVSWEAYKNNTPPIKISIPLDFKGAGEGYSPEELFGLSILNCIIGMFKILAEKLNLPFEKVDGKINIILNKDETEDSLAITEVDLDFKIINAEDFNAVKTELEKAIIGCPVSRSVQCAKTYNITTG